MSDGQTVKERYIFLSAAVNVDCVYMLECETDTRCIDTGPVFGLTLAVAIEFSLSVFFFYIQTPPVKRLRR